MTPQQIEALKLAFESHCKNERHHTVAETRYWCNQYKLVAQAAIEALAQPEQAPVVYQCPRCATSMQVDLTAKAALAQPEQEPVAWWNDTGTHIDLNVSGRGDPLYTVPPQRTKQKMVMWPCLIDTADFSKGTVTVVMQCDDYKVSAGTHWLSTIPPQRTWVALTDEEFHDLQIENIDDPWANFKAIEAKLKEKNT